MKKTIANAIYINNIVVWAVIGCCCIVASGTFIKKLFKDLSAGNEISLPGVIILVAAVLGLFVLSIIRIKKYINRLRQT
jgi:hypothetical protein